MTSRFARMLRSTVRVGLLASISAGGARAEWNQYRGPTDDGISKEKIATEWPASGPKVLWKIPMGKGFGTFAFGAGKAFIFSERNGDEVCIALDPNTGKELWATDIGPTTKNTDGDPCPRTTPAVDGDRVYIYSTFLKLDCLDAATGKPVWSHDLVKEFKGQAKTKGIGNWGNSDSPLVHGDLVFIVGGGPGESLMAFNKKTGAVVWKTQDEKLTHASPTLATIAGVRQVIFFTQSGLVSCEPQTGKELWRARVPVQRFDGRLARRLRGRRLLFGRLQRRRRGVQDLIRRREFHRERTLADPEGKRQPLDHAGLQRRLPLRHVRLQGILQRTAPLRRHPHR